MSKGMKIGGIILVIIGVILVCGAVWAGITYADGIAKQEEIEDKLKEYEERGDVDNYIYKENKKRYDENEDMLATKEQAMGICTPLGVILLIIGIILIKKSGKKEMGAVNVYPEQIQQQQYPSQEQQYQQQLYQQPQYPSEPPPTMQQTQVSQQLPVAQPQAQPPPSPPR